MVANRDRYLATIAGLLALRHRIAPAVAGSASELDTLARDLAKPEISTAELVTTAANLWHLLDIYRRGRNDDPEIAAALARVATLHRELQAVGRDDSDTTEAAP
ncbi:hypothetical protein [Polymorphospora sp. NPDC050346]|uniref:hypothetical protein n=1 Tax=Polymorphospora sp. NPDC050346 TaxID=3155780 RepID=UPI0033C034B4